MIEKLDVPAWALLDPSESLAEADRRFRSMATPIDRRKEPDRWTASDFVGVSRTDCLRDFWGAPIPGSGAWDVMFVGAANSHTGHTGFEDPIVRSLITRGLQARINGDIQNCVILAEDLLTLFEATMYQPETLKLHPELVNTPPYRASAEDRYERVFNGWLGQIAGGAFGTALEGCTGAGLRSTYGTLRNYVGEVSTLNDDCVYEILTLDVLERHGLQASTENYAREWSARLPFGWSAEWVTLNNLQHGVDPAAAGQNGNPMFDWIGAQMRSMIFGMVAPGDVSAAVRLALPEALVSHRGGGVLGAAFAAALTSAAFVIEEPRELLTHVAPLLDVQSSYGSVVNSSIETCRQTTSSAEAFTLLDQRLWHRNWIHGEPNIAAVICALWFSDGDFTNAMSDLASFGLDVDCNAGLVGTILSIQQNTVPKQWSEPLGGFVDTYLENGKRFAISDLASRTTALQKVGR
jgi:ADP-ribosylglycohydrolase